MSVMTPSQKKLVRDYWRAKGKLDASRGKTPDFKEGLGGTPRCTLASGLYLHGEEEEVAGKAYLDGYDKIAGK